MGKLWTPQNQGKKKSSPTLKGQENRWGARKKLDQDTWGFPRAWDPRDMQQDQIGTKTNQGGMPRNTKNKDKCVLIMMQKRDQKIWELTTHE